MTKSPEKIDPGRAFDILSNGKWCIVLHAHADQDCLGSAHALQAVLGHPVWAPQGLDRGANVLREVIGTEITDEILKDGKTSLVLLDTPRMDVIQVGEWGKIMIIDHHPVHETEADFLLNDERFTSTAEIVFEMLQSRNIPPDRASAIGLLAGLISDTGRFRRGDQGTLMRAAALLHAASSDENREIRLEQFLEIISVPKDDSERIAALKGLERMKHVRKGGIIIACTQVSSFEGGVASAMISAGADVALVASTRETSVRITGRCNQRGLDAGVDLDRLFREAAVTLGGGGGGHPGAAVFESSGDAEALLNMLTEMVMERLHPPRASSVPV
ncbi:MAG: DHH family phosphoesterase [Methanomassiliicoccales archaeon]